MVYPVTRLLLFCASLTVPLLPPCAAATGRTNSPVRDAIVAGWGKYDPSIRQAYLKALAESSPPAPPPVEAKPVTAPDPATLILPKMTVLGAKEAQPPPLPRLHIAEPAKTTKEELFESPDARRARLIQKHFTPLEQALNRSTLPLFGGSLAGQAAQRESAESASRQLNTIADLLELSVLAGLESPEEQKKLRAEYLRLYYGRPR